MKFRELFDENMTPKWDEICRIKAFGDMKHTLQSAVWHKEGNVKQHTILVTEAMQQILDDKGYDKNSEQYLMLMSAAVCHDLGKVPTTKFDEEKQDYTTKCHGAAGARITRKLFYDEEFSLREKVCYMVRHHMDLHHIFDKEDFSTRSIIRLSHGLVTVEEMLLLNMADSFGSKNDVENRDTIADKARRVRELAEMFDCFTKPYTFTNEYDKIRFFHFRDRTYPECQSLPKDYGEFTMYVMIGVPGSGKNYYIENNLKDVVHISRDDIRTEIGIKGEKPQGNKEQESHVTEIFNERMLECCRNKQNFVLNNTNMLKKYRDAYTDMTMRFMPKIVYVYCEAPSIDECKNRRRGQMPLDVIDRMFNSFEFPEPTEYNEIIYSVQR